MTCVTLKESATSLVMSEVCSPTPSATSESPSLSLMLTGTRCALSRKTTQLVNNFVHEGLEVIYDSLQDAVFSILEAVPTAKSLGMQ